MKIRDGKWKLENGKWKIQTSLQAIINGGLGILILNYCSLLYWIVSFSLKYKFETLTDCSLCYFHLTIRNVIFIRLLFTALFGLAIFV